MKIIKYWGDITMDVPPSELLGGMSPLSHGDRRPCIRLNGGDAALRRANCLVSLQLVERKKWQIINK